MFLSRRPGKYPGRPAHRPRGDTVQSSAGSPRSCLRRRSSVHPGNISIF